MFDLITPEQLNQQQADFWNKAKSAIDLKNYGYAVSLLKVLVKQLPGFLEGRKVLRSCEIKLNPTPKGKSMFGGLRITTVKRDPISTISSIEDELENDPYSIPANEILYNASMELNVPDIAAFALETIRRGYPDNKKNLMALALHYESRQMFLEAAGAYHDIVKVEPSNSVAIKGEKDCSARATMQQGNWESGSFEDKMKSQGEAGKLDQGAKIGLTKGELENRLAELSAVYAQNQANLAVVRDIAAVYEQMEDWGNACSFYSYAFTLSNSDISLQAKADAAGDKYRSANMDTLKRQAALDPENAELQEQLKAAQLEFKVAAVIECKRRVDGNPTDAQLRFDLGEAMFNAEQYTEAIPELQKARNNPYLRQRAMLMLGKCYESKNMNDMALKQLEEANKEISEMNDTKKEVLYLMGVLNDKLDRKEAALECFKQIYDTDYSYRDVATRVESSYS